MYVKDRRSGLRGLLPKVFAVFWVVLGGFSGAYLYSVLQEPQLVKMTSPAPAPAAAAPEEEAVSEDALATYAAADEAQQREIAELKATIDQLRQRLSGVDTRLTPIEKLLGPVAAMPQHESAVTTDAPSAEPKPMEEATEPIPTNDDSANEDADAATAPPPPEPASDPEPESDTASPAEQPEPEAEAVQEPEPDLEPDVPSGEVTPAEEPLPPAGIDADEMQQETASLRESPPAIAVPNLPPGTARFGIEIGTVENRDGLRPLWRNMLTNHAALVAGLEARRIKASDDQWRLIAGPFADATEAARACALFRKAELPCEPTVFAGDSL